MVNFPGGSVVKNLPANTGDMGSTPGSGRSPGEGNGNPLQYSGLENSMDRGAWWAIVHGVTKEWDKTEQLNNNNKGVVGGCTFSRASLVRISAMSLAFTL